MQKPQKRKKKKHAAAAATAAADAAGPAGSVADVPQSTAEAKPSVGAADEIDSIFARRPRKHAAVPGLAEASSAEKPKRNFKVSGCWFQIAGIIVSSSCNRVIVVHSQNLCSACSEDGGGIGRIRHAPQCSSQGQQGRHLRRGAGKVSQVRSECQTRRYTCFATHILLIVWLDVRSFTSCGFQGR